jgi:hypothetical protein
VQGVLAGDLQRRWRPALVTELLTNAEHRAMDLTVTLVNLVMHEVIGFGPTRDADVREFVAAVHAVQQMVLSQAAARAYPDRYRLLGGMITGSAPNE